MGWWDGYDWGSGSTAPPMEPPDPRLLRYDMALAARLARERAERGNDRRFYQRAAWARLRRRVMDEWHGACADCLAKSPARFTPATTVHHDARVERLPGWALSEWWVDGGKVRRNLFPLCADCHEARHERGRHAGERKPPHEITPERW